MKSTQAHPAADAQPFLPAKPDASLARLRLAVQTCQGCDLYKNATQAVFGDGRVSAKMILIGEQPGDQEDRQGRPFVGPAGRLLDDALKEAGIDRSDVYLTNAVKHFKWKPAPRGKRRLHAKPGAREIRACLPWLQREILLIKPPVAVCLGATAGQSLFGSGFNWTANRGRVLRDTPRAPAVVITAHPSAILRVPNEDDKKRQFAALVADLQKAHAALSSS